MNSKIVAGIFLSSLLAVNLAATVLAHDGEHPTAAAVGNQPMEHATTELTDGEVRKIDLATGKITLKHGDIKNLEMPGMTMVFQAKEAAMLSSLKVGDKIRFRAVRDNGKIVVSEIQVVK